ncbi:tumor protein p53-inducible protein 13 [Elgaria multicarinata webbii]|uniref:tumor protein p53-inducible protein 13 n=1 Tax=Elgaria multicarinata webbii TaxID=159646 RepID=UPI002FCCCB5F
MGVPPPLPPPVAPILLFLLSLAGSGAPGDGGEENKVVFTDTNRVYSLNFPGNSRPHRLTGAAYGEYGYWPPQHGPHSLKVSQKLFRRWDGDRKLGVSGRQRRAIRWLGRLLYPRMAMDGSRNLGPGGAGAPPPAAAISFRDEREDIPKPGNPGQAQLNATAHLSFQPSLAFRPSLAIPPSKAGTAQKTGCQCPDQGLSQAQDQPGQGVQGQRSAGVRFPTPRTEEAAWAASALTFLLVVLTLAVLYARLHRRCHRSRSLYWTVHGEEGRDTVAAIVKRRLLSAPGRRKKRPRQQQQQQQRPLLPTTSSESSA